MKKQKIKNLLPLYITGDLPARKAEEVKKAIAANAELREELVRIEGLMKKISSVKTPEFPSHLEKTIKKIVGTVHPEPSRTTTRTVLSGALSAAVAVILILVLFVAKGDKISQTEEWLANNIESIDNLNGYGDLSAEILSGDELVSLKEEIQAQITEEFSEVPEIIEQTDSILGWSTFLEKIVTDENTNNSSQ